MQCLGHVERCDLADGTVHRALLDEGAPVEQHAHRLDRVEGNAFGAREDLGSQGLGETRDEPGQQLLHRLGRQRLQVERGEVAVACAPGRAALVQLGSSEREHEQLARPRPLEQVLDEVEQAGVGPLHVLEGEHGRVHVGEPLEEKPPRGEQVLLVARWVLGEAEELREPRLDEPALLGVEQMLVERGPQLCQCGCLVLVLGDEAAHAHHVRECPVGDALAVGEAAAAVPVDGLGDAVEVLVELPRQPRLADPGDSCHRHEMGAPLLRTRVEEVLDLA